MKNHREIKITHIYILIVTALLITAVVVGISMQQSSATIRRLQEKTEEYISVQEAISSMKEASDYLTEKCRSYVVSGDTDHINAFFDEVYNERRRDKAIETITEYNESESIQKSLESSLKTSNELIKVEKYAMKLSTISHGIKDPQVDEYLEDVRISEEDLELSADQQLKKATNMVFDENYESYKSSIKKGVFDSLDKLISNTKTDQLEIYKEAVRISNREHVLFFLMLFLTLIALFATAVLVILPLNRSISYIRHNEMLPVNGSQEYNFLAVTFNRMLEKNKKHSEILSYEATHDELTGVYNRKMFETTRAETADKDNALILFDIDHFKEINDTYGHETGDKILKKVSSALATSFRNEDYVCRIGGDEFAVIMVQMSPEIGYVVSRKIDLVRSKLQADDGLPATTLSIGAAFTADSEHPEDLFRNADAALYRVKNAGRNGFAFFKDIPSEGSQEESAS